MKMEMNTEHSLDGPSSKKQRTVSQEVQDFEQLVLNLNDSIPADIIGSSNAHDPSLSLNGLLDAPVNPDPFPPSTDPRPSSRPASAQQAPSPHGSQPPSAQQHHQHRQLSQLLAKTPHSQPLPPALSGGTVTNERNSPNQLQQRQSPHLGQQQRSSSASSLHLTTNGPSTAFAGGPGGGSFDVGSFPPHSGAPPNRMPFQNGPILQPGMQQHPSNPPGSSPLQLSNPNQSLMSNIPQGPYGGMMQTMPNGPPMQQLRPNPNQNTMIRGMVPAGMRQNGPTPRQPGPMTMMKQQVSPNVAGPQGPNGLQGGQRQPMMSGFAGSNQAQMGINPVSPPSAPMQQNNQQQQQQHALQQNLQQLQTQQQQQQNNLASQLSPPNCGDPEKRKIIQQQLVLLLHAHKCQRREMSSNNDNGQRQECRLPHCRTMKNVLTHMTQCTAGKSCQMPHCASSRQIISHWKTCSRADCPVCLPLKQASDRNKPPNVFDFATMGGGNQIVNAVQVGSNGIGPGPGQPNMSRSFSGANPSQMMNHVQSGQMNQANQNKLLDDLIGGGMGGSQSFNPNQNQLTSQGSLSNLETILNSPPSVGPASSLMGGPPNGPGSVDSALGFSMQGGPQGLVQGLMQSGSAASPMQFSPQSVCTKDWHREFPNGPNNNDLRNHLIHKLVQAIFPYKDPSALQDKRMYNLIAYARKVEADMYESANTREEYYSMLAQKIYKIQKELEDKRRKRQEERRNPNALPGQNSPGLDPGNPPMNQMLRGPSLAPGAGGPNSSPLRSGGGFPSGGGPVNVNAQLMSEMQRARMMSPSGGPGGFPVPSPLGGGINGPPSNGSMYGQMNGQWNGMPPYGQQQQQQGRNMFGENQYMVEKVENGGDMGLSMDAGNSVDSLTLSQASSVDDFHAHQRNPSGSSEPSSSPRQYQPPNDPADNIQIKPEPSDDPQGGPNNSPPQQQQPPSPADHEGVKQENDEGSQGSGFPSGSTVSPVREMTSKEAGGVSKGGIRKVHSPEELQEALISVVERLWKLEPEGAPFRMPVDPQALAIPDYFTIVKKPMDLSTIRQKLEAGAYDDPWQFTEDMWQMFNNAWIYNRKGTRVYKFCTKLAEVFEVEMDPVMSMLGYCCGRRYVFQPQVLCCYGKQLCTIPRDTTYMSYQGRYTYCQRCFSEIPGDTVTLESDPSQPNTMIRKDLFTEMRNDQVDYEPFVHCKHCGRKNHQICVLHMEQIWPEGFSCDGCLRAQGKKRKENRFSSKKLPQTKLGQHIENHINNYLTTKHTGEAGEVTIRVLSSCDKIVEVKPGMKHKFVDTGEISETFPYRTKAIFAFEEIDGTDVCFFGMHVQEYGSDCPMPNARRVYIAYLDSVHFFRPKHVRTQVYHEILLSYISYCKNLGYTMAHIWACPPSEGDDYVFHCHPPEQKIPKPKRLQEWYKKMLDKGLEDKIIIDYKDILRHAMEDSVASAVELPYFEGDFWPNVLEECIKEVEQLELQQRDEDSDDSDDTLSEPGKGKKRPKKSNKKQRTNKQQGRKSTKKAIQGIATNANTLTQKIFSTMDKHKDVFFVIRLHNVQQASRLPAIIDPDPLISCELMDGRDAFLTIARDRHYEFSSLRRTKFSTMAMLYELHNQGQDRFVYTCNSCKNHVETRWHCKVCDDYDQCVYCHEKEGHPHPMDKLGFDLDDGSASKDPKNPSANPQESRLLSIQRCIQSLMHASQCKDANCRLSSCTKMKRVLAHTKTCKRKSNGGCAICKQLIALCCYHAKQCNELKCFVPFCNHIKQKLRQQRIQQDFQRTQFNRRRAAIMRMGPINTGVPANSGPGPMMVPSPTPGVGNKSLPSAGVQDVVRGIQEHAKYQASGGKGMGPGGFGSQGATHNVNVFGGGSMAPAQGFQGGQFGGKPVMGGKPNNPVMGGGMVGMQHGAVGVRGALPSVNRWENPGAGNMVQNAPVANALGARLAQGNPNLPRPINANSHPAYQQLLEALRAPASADQQRQVSEILRNNPQLMAAFIRHTRQTGEPRSSALVQSLVQQGIINPQQAQQGQYGQVRPQMGQQQQQAQGQQMQMRMPYGGGQQQVVQGGVQQGQQQQQQYQMVQSPPQPQGQLQQRMQHNPAYMSSHNQVSGGMAFSNAGVPSSVPRQRFSAPVPSPQQQQQQQQQQPQPQYTLNPQLNLNMGPPNSFNLQQPSPGGDNPYGALPRPPGVPGGVGSLRSPASSVRSPQTNPAQQPPQRQSTTPGPRPLASPSPRLQPPGGGGGGYDLPLLGGNDVGMHGGHMTHGQPGHYDNFHGSVHPGHMPQGGVSSGHYHHPSPLTPQDQLSKFVDNL